MHVSPSKMLLPLLIGSIVSFAGHTEYNEQKLAQFLIVVNDSSAFFRSFCSTPVCACV